MSTQYLRGRRVGFLVARNGVEEDELKHPWLSLEKLGAEVQLIGIEGGVANAVDQGEPSRSYEIDVVVDDADPSDFDALILPGGVANAAELSQSSAVVDFVRKFSLLDRPIGAICHAAWTLVQADVLRGRRLTSWPDVRIDIQKAGGIWVDQRVVVDEFLVTSRMPEDLPAFITQLEAMLDR